MKYLFIFFVLLLSACSKEIDKPEVVLKTDSAFSKMALDSGAEKAFKFFAANEILEFSIDSFNTSDSTGITDSIKPAYTLFVWSPKKAKVSKSGDLAWTSGTWYQIIKTKREIDTVKKGNYITFWQKQDDGSWKYIIDRENISPDDFK